MCIEDNGGIQTWKYGGIEEYDKYDDAYEPWIQDADIGFIQNRGRRSGVISGVYGDNKQ